MFIFGGVVVVGLLQARFEYVEWERVSRFLVHSATTYSATRIHLQYNNAQPMAIHVLVGAVSIHRPGELRFKRV
jgi:hypothetical protein